jgi:hypothetical protein
LEKQQSHVEGVEGSISLNLGLLETFNESNSYCNYRTSRRTMTN